MRDQSKAVLNTKLQVEKWSRIQGVPDAIIIDGYVMLWTVHWPTSDTVEDNIINCMGSRNYDLERNVEYQIFDWYIGNSTKQMTRFNRSGNDASRKNQLSLRTTRLTRTDCLICHYIWLSTFRTMKLNWLWQEKSKYRNNSTLQRDDLKNTWRCRCIHHWLKLR